MAKKKTAKKVKTKFRTVVLSVPAIRRYQAGKPIVKGEKY